MCQFCIRSTQGRCWFCHGWQFVMLSFVFSCHQPGESRWVRSHDSDRRCPRVSDRPGLPPRRPRMSGGLLEVFIYRRLGHALRLSQAMGWELRTAFRRASPGSLHQQRWGRCPRSSAPAALGLRWEPAVALGRQQQASAAGSCQKKQPHRLIPPISQPLIEYVQLNVLVCMPGTSLQEFYSIYKWRKVVFGWQLNPLKMPTVLFLFD